MTVDLRLTGPQSPWAVLLPDGTSTVPVPWQRRARRDAVARLTSLPQRTPVALVASGPLGHHQLRRAAARAGIVIDHEYVVVPGLQSGPCVVEAHPDTMSLLWQNLAAPPTRLARGARMVATLASVGRRHPPSWAVGAVAPRVVTGHRAEQ